MTSQEKKMVKYAVLGTSFISRVMVEAIERSDCGTVQCVASRTPANVEKFATEFNIALWYTDYKKAINDPEVDVVFIGLPTHLHAEYTKVCAQAGKHILCEKSFTVNAREARSALEIVKQCSVFCMEAQMYRCHPIIEALKEQVLTVKPLGNIVSINAVFTAPIINLFNRTAGGAISDLGCYPISLIRYLFGEPERFISATADIVAAEGTSNAFDREASCELLLQEGIVAKVRTSNNEDLVWQFDISCEKGMISLSNLWEPSINDAINITSAPSSAPSNDYTRSIVVNVPDGKNFYTLQIDTVNSHVLAGHVEADSPAMNWQDSINNMVVLDEWRKLIGLKYPMDDHSYNSGIKC